MPGPVAVSFADPFIPTWEEDFLSAACLEEIKMPADLSLACQSERRCIYDQKYDAKWLPTMKAWSLVKFKTTAEAQQALTDKLAVVRSAIAACAKEKLVQPAVPTTRGVITGEAPLQTHTVADDVMAAREKKREELATAAMGSEATFFGALLSPGCAPGTEGANAEVCREEWKLIGAAFRDALYVCMDPRVSYVSADEHRLVTVSMECQQEAMTATHEAIIRGEATWAKGLRTLWFTHYSRLATERQDLLAARKEQRQELKSLLHQAKGRAKDDLAQELSTFDKETLPPEIDAGQMVADWEHLLTERVMAVFESSPVLPPVAPKPR